MRLLHLSVKQREMLTVIVAGEGNDAAGNLIPCDLDTLISRLGYAPSKQSIQFSIRALIRRDMIYRGDRVNRRNRKRVLILPTETGRTAILGPKPSYLEPLSLELTELPN